MARYQAVARQGPGRTAGGAQRGASEASAAASAAAPRHQRHRLSSASGRQASGAHRGTGSRRHEGRGRCEERQKVAWQEPGSQAAGGRAAPSAQPEAPATGQRAGPWTRVWHSQLGPQKGIKSPRKMAGEEARNIGATKLSEVINKMSNCKHLLINNYFKHKCIKLSNQKIHNC